MIDNDALLREVLSKLNRGDCPDRRWPDRDGEYWALCPFHSDQHSGSFSVSTRGYKCFACGAEGGLLDLAKRLGIEVLQCCSVAEGYITKNIFSLAAYAEAKKLPVDFLGSLGLHERQLRGETAVVIPYHDAEGQEVARRYRLAMHGGRRFRWAAGSKVMPYGLERLRDAKEAGYIILVEGESDAQTLWYHRLPALGVPGATTWKPEWTAYLAGLTVYVWAEPDAGGEAFTEAVGRTLPDARIMRPPAGLKDISEAHVLGYDVPALLGQMMKEARPYRELQAQALDAEARELERKAGALLTCPDILAELGKLLPRLGLVGEDRNAKLLYLALTTRLLERPVNVVVKGPSAGGKSFLVSTVLRLMPEEAFADFTSMSPHALIYDNRPLSHRFIVLYEAAGLGQDRQDEPNLLAYCIRSLLSDGVLRYQTVERTPEGMRPREIVREGPTGFITTTTWTSLHGENETRMLSLTVRDDPSQTKMIFHALAERANGVMQEEPDLTPWLALQTWLERVGERRVTIPFAHKLAELASPKAVRLRRDFGQVLNLIKAHAILHQRSRARDEHGRIVATVEDYRAVYGLVIDILSEGVEAAVSPAIRETVQAVAELTKKHERPVSVTEVAAYLRLDKSAASRRIRTALERNYLVNMEERRGKPALLQIGEPLPEEEPILPAPEELLGEGKNNFCCIPSGNTATLQHLPSIGDAVYLLGDGGTLRDRRPRSISDIVELDGKLCAVFEDDGLLWPLERCARL